MKFLSVLTVLTVFFMSDALAKPHKKKIHNYSNNPVVEYDGRIVEHPAGCPRRAFCGCGVSVKVFGRPVRELFLASNWRKFPSAMAAPGMVAWRSGHVMYIESLDANGNAVVYDPNSGGHRTRVHTRSLAGYRIVNPHGTASRQPQTSYASAQVSSY